VATLRIGELLVQEGLITTSQLEAALKAQQIFGGRLGTNLVEAGFVSEEDLARLLSRQLGIPMVEPHELGDVPRWIRELVPPGVARRYQVVPFRYDEKRDRVSLAVADPGNLQKVDEIQFALGRTVDFHVCPEVMLAFALEKHYGVERQRRYIRIAGVPEAELNAFARDEQRPAARAAERPARGRRTHREELLAAIIDAPGKRELVTTVTDLLAEHAEQVVFLAARGKELLAWEARGLPLSEADLRRITVAVEGSPLLSGVCESLSGRSVTRLAEEPLRTTLEQQLFVDCAEGLHVLPLIVNRQVFGAFLFGRFDERAFDESLPLLVEVMKRVACRLQIFSLMEYLAAPL